MRQLMLKPLQLLVGRGREVEMKGRRGCVTVICSILYLNDLIVL